MKRVIIVFLSAICLLGLSKRTSAQCTGTPITSFTVTNIVDVSCFNGSDGEIEVTLVGGQPPFTYSLVLETGGGDIPLDQKSNTTDQFAVFSNLFANAPFGGTYKITVVTSNGGSPPAICTRRTITNIDVAQPAELTVSVANVTAACTPGIGAISLDVAGGTAPYSFTWSGPTVIGNVEDPTNLDEGTYSVIIRDANFDAGNPGFCETSINNIIVPGPPTTSDAGLDQTVCDPTATLDGNLAGPGRRALGV